MLGVEGNQIDLRTLVGQRVLTSVKVGNLIVPSTSLTEHLRRYTSPAVFNSAGIEPQYAMSLSGSATLIKYSDRYFAFTTLHQLKHPQLQYDFDQFCLIGNRPHTLVTPQRIIYATGNDSEDFDCVLFEFTKTVKRGDLPSFEWYEITEEQYSIKTPKPDFALSIGYPGFRNYIDYETAHFGMSPNAIAGREVEPSLKGRLSFAPREKLHFDPSGFSGAPVFGVKVEQANSRVFFAGIVTEAGKSQIHFISFKRLTELLKKAFNND
ncbi:hypothetical protein [Celeribacter halophilus]|uniref:hypothetical protein n=1 Tax=Celeribacter halophilus TaxID=576117 RepID=UPI003A8D60E5